MRMLVCRLNQKFKMYRDRVAAVVSEVFQKKLMEAMDTIKKATGLCVCVCVKHWCECA
jgi:hypothetical protein